MTQSAPKRIAPSIRTNRRSRVDRRSGLSMIEVLIAITVLGMSLVAIGGLFQLGLKGANQANLRSQAQILADSVMAEVASGVLDLDSISETPFPDDSDWVYSVSVSEAEYIGLVSVSVTVAQADVEYPFEYSLFRFMPDPNYELPSAPQQIPN